MNSKEIIESILQNFNYSSFPEEYKDSLIKVLEVTKEELKDNLLSITLGGSGGKNKITVGWSDLDIYLIVNKYDINQISRLQKKLADNPVHIGLTIYSMYEIENDLIDFKTKIMIYEKNNYNINPTIYGDDYFKDISYQDVYDNDLANYPIVLQAFKRMYIEVINKERKIDKTYIKKMIVLLKCILSSHQIFTYGYNEVYQEYNQIINRSTQIPFTTLIQNLEVYEGYIENISREIIEYTEREELFKKTTTKNKQRKLQVTA